MLEGYNSYFNCCADPHKKGYSGVALYTKTNPIKVTKGIGNKDVFKNILIS